MRQAHFHGNRQINNYVIVRTRLQHIQNRVADFQRIFRLRSGKAFGRILKPEIALVLGCQPLNQFGTVHSDLFDLFFGHPEHLFPLGNTDGIVEMNDRAGCALASIKGFADDVLPALGQHLNRHILRNHAVLDQSPEEFILRLGCCREAYLNLLETNIQK